MRSRCCTVARKTCETAHGRPSQDPGPRQDPGSLDRSSTQGSGRVLDCDERALAFVRSVHSARTYHSSTQRLHTTYQVYITGKGAYCQRRSSSKLMVCLTRWV